jgi:hypothetical protein
LKATSPTPPDLGGGPETTPGWSGEAGVVHRWRAVVLVGEGVVHRGWGVRLGWVVSGLAWGRSFAKAGGVGVVA